MGCCGEGTGLSLLPPLRTSGRPHAAAAGPRWQLRGGKLRPGVGKAALPTALAYIPLSAPKATQASATTPSALPVPGENNQKETRWDSRVYYKKSKRMSYRNERNLSLT